MIVLLYSHKSEAIRPEIQDIVQQIVKYNKLDSESVGMAGDTTEQFWNFIMLRDNASFDELLQLTKHNNSVVKGYACWALADNKYPSIYEIIIPFIETGETVVCQNCDIVMTIQLSSVLYYRVYNQNFYNNLSIIDSLFFVSQIQKIDSVILFSNKAITLLDIALKHNSANPDTYNRVKFLASRKNKQAIAALALYEKKSDIPFIIEQGENSFLAISSFPDKEFWTFLLKYEYTNRTLDYFMAIASFKNEDALKLLLKIYSNCNTAQVESLDESLIKNYCNIYQDLILKIWQLSNTIDLNMTKSLIRDCPDKSSQLFAKGLLNSNQYNFLEIDGNYGTKDSIMPLMLGTIAKYNKELLLEICKKNIETESYMNLVSVLDIVVKNNFVEVQQNILNRLTKKTYPFEMFQLARALISFKDSESDLKLLKILKEKRSVWDSGNWSNRFKALLSNNKLEID
jgi:hypothetical protein